MSLHQIFDIAPTVNAGAKDARRQSWSEYQEEVRERLAVYENAYLDLFKRWVRKRISDSAWQTIGGRYAWTEIENVSQDVIQKTTKIYNRSADRAFLIEASETDANGVQEGVSEPDEIFNDVLQNNLEFDYDAKMDRAIKLAMVTGGALIRPWVMEDSQDRIRFQTLTADQFTPFIREDDPGELSGLTYFIAFPDANGDDDIIHTFVWDMDGRHMKEASGGLATGRGWIELDENDKIVNMALEEEYPYKTASGEFFLPFIPVRIDTPEGRLFNQGMGVDLFDGTILASWYSVQKEWIIRHQSHKQFVLSGPGAEKMGNQFIDATSPIVLPHGDSSEIGLQVFDMKTDPESIELAIDKIYERLGTRRGISLEELKESAQRQTAEALRIQKSGQQEYTLFLQRENRVTERLFGEAIRIVWNAHNTPEISEAGRFTVDYANPTENDPYVHFPERKELVSMNVLSAADLVQDFNTDINDPESALDLLTKNREINRSTARFSSQAAAGVAANIPPPVSGASAPEIPVNEPEIETEIEET